MSLRARGSRDHVRPGVVKGVYWAGPDILQDADNRSSEYRDRFITGLTLGADNCKAVGTGILTMSGNMAGSARRILQPGEGECGVNDLPC